MGRRIARRSERRVRPAAGRQEGGARVVRQAWTPPARRGGDQDPACDRPTRRGDRADRQTSQRLLLEEGLPWCIAELEENQIRTIATDGYRALGELGHDVDEQYVAWVKRRQPQYGFPRKHIWI
jgi:hypothetical protein